MLAGGLKLDTIRLTIIIGERNKNRMLLKNSTVKIILAVAVVVLIVAATFAYGNSQRQAQLKKKDQQAQEQRLAETKPTAAVSASPAASVSPTASPAASAQATTTPQLTPPSGTTPETGGGLFAAMPLTVLSVLGFARRSSRRKLEDSLRD
ncbi:hypothetical protein KBC99_01140 [Candidatus Saccharibacteria bacterium]|nr:hypothetical protein [Candidatus Saccharibacteria bacterium]